jgi:hypothetical protein
LRYANIEEWQTATEETKMENDYDFATLYEATVPGNRREADIRKALMAGIVDGTAAGRKTAPSDARHAVRTCASNQVAIAIHDGKVVA